MKSKIKVDNRLEKLKAGDVIKSVFEGRIYIFMISEVIDSMTKTTRYVLVNLYAETATPNGYLTTDGYTIAYSIESEKTALDLIKSLKSSGFEDIKKIDCTLIEV